MIVRPSRNNTHQFLALENTCFFDICLPNYTLDCHRKITYFKEVSDEEDKKPENSREMKNYSINDVIKLEYNTTNPNLPPGFQISELSYRGSMEY